MIRTREGGGGDGEGGGGEGGGGEGDGGGGEGGGGEGACESWIFEAGAVGYCSSSCSSIKKSARDCHPPTLLTFALLPTTGRELLMSGC